MRTALALVLLTSGVGCGSYRTDVPNVQRSSRASPSRTVSVGGALHFAPSCVEIAPGQTVEWTNVSLDDAADVTSIEEPRELYSPNLQVPLDCPDGDGVCWRHTFASVGCYEYYDSQTGVPSGLGTGIVCVREGASCRGLCCEKVEDCPSDGTVWACVGRRCVDAVRSVPRTCEEYLDALERAGETL